MLSNFPFHPTIRHHHSVRRLLLQTARSVCSTGAHIYVVVLLRSVMTQQFCERGRCAVPGPLHFVKPQSASCCSSFKLPAAVNAARNSPALIENGQPCGQHTMGIRVFACVRGLPKCRIPLGFRCSLVFTSWCSASRLGFAGVFGP